MNKIVYIIIFKGIAIYLLFLGYFKLYTILNSVYPRIELINKSTDISVLLIWLIIAFALFFAKITIDKDEKK